jgi:hypothetical protein
MQVILTVPVKPLMVLAETVVLPDWPGEEIVKLVGEAPNPKSGVAVMVTVTADEVELP